jgi:peptidoglycan/xylan/chitin deacetylase (PgdA/CDA1 family)
MLWWVIACVATIVLAHTAPFPFLLERFAPSQSLWRVPRGPGPPTVYFTFDDGPNPAATPELLDALKEVDAVATFFLIDAHLDPETAPIVRRMFEEGHGVALHSDTRKLMFATPAGLAATLTGNADRIEQLAGHRPCRLFRPHAGWRSGSMYEGLRAIDHKLVGWGWGLWDFNWYRAREAESVARRLARRVSAGDIVVMHDGHHVEPRANRQYAIDATRLLVPAVKARGFRFGNLCRDVAEPRQTGEAGSSELEDTRRIY